MTREEILNGMSEEEFYDMYPDQESWENAQQMKLGGLSGAPHDGQPTARQFFNYGSHANDAVNVPMSNPFFASHGGTYYGGPIRPYQTGGYKPAPNPDTYFDEQDEALDYPAKGNNVNIDYSKVTKQGPALSQYSTSELNNMGANIPVPNPAQDARFAKIAAYNKEHPYIPAGGNLFKRPDGSADRFNYTNGAYTPYQGSTSQPLANNAYGGYMDQGGNMASPMNYGAFNVPMQYGGYEQAYGGSLDESNNQDYPILEEGGRAALMAMIKAHSKKMRKAYKDGGDTVMQGGNSTDYPTTMRDTFKNVLKQNIQNHMINEEEKSLSEEMMQVGGYAGGPGMNYNNTNFSQPNQQNQALANMYQQRIGATKDNLSNDFSNLGNATSYLGYTANPYQKTSVKAQDGTETGKQRTLSEEEWSWLDEQRKAKEDKANYNKYFKENRTSTRGMDYAPMNYNPYNKISKDDVAKLKQVAATPTTGWKLKEFDHKHFGPWGKTNMKFGYKDISNKDFYEDNMKIKDIPGTESNSMQNNNNQSNNQSNDPYADYKYNPYNPASQNPRNTESWFDKMRGVMGDKKNEQEESWIDKYRNNRTRKADQRQDAAILKNRLKREAEQDKAVGPYVSPEEEMAYGGLTRAQYGVDHKSTNPADGLYDNAGKKIDSEPNSMNPVKMESISATPGFSNYIKDEGLKLKGQQEHLKDPETGSMYTGPEKELDVTTKNRPGFDNEAMANWSIAGINTLAGGLEQGQNAKNEKQLANLQLADNAFMATPANAQSRGDYDPNSGMFRMDQMNPVQFPGGMGYSAYGGSFQDGGMQDQAAPQQEQIMQGVATMLQQGAQPEQVAQQLVQMGIPQEQAVQIIKAVMQQLQGGQEQPMQPAMRYGGYAMGGYQEEDSYEDDLDENEIAELKRQGYNVEYLD